MGFINSATNWMPSDILERLTWRDVADLMTGWKKYPPLQRMFQDWLKLQGFQYADAESLSDTGAVGGDSWFSSLPADQFTSELSERANTLAAKLKLN